MRAYTTSNETLAFRMLPFVSNSSAHGDWEIRTKEAKKIEVRFSFTNVRFNLPFTTGINMLSYQDIRCAFIIVCHIFSELAWALECVQIPPPHQINAKGRISKHRQEQI